MRVFVTGASGWIGSATVDELLAAGHDVEGLARSDASAAKLEAKGARVRRGDLDDLGSLRSGAEAAEGVVHLANKHDFAHPEVSNKAERDAVQTLGDVLAGSDRPLVMASGLGGPDLGRRRAESDASVFTGPDSMRGGSENLALDFVARGVRSVPVRFAPTVHGTGDHGFVSVLVAAAREHGEAGYVGEGTTSWAAVHVSDAAKLVRYGVEAAPAGTILHAVAEEAVASKAIAEGIAAFLGVRAVSVAPEEAQARIGGFIGTFFGMEMSASSARTRELSGWTPTGPTLLEDIANGAYAS